MFLKLMEINLRTFRCEFSIIDIWFTDQNSKLLEIENRVNIISTKKIFSLFNNCNIVHRQQCKCGTKPKQRT